METTKKQKGEEKSNAVPCSATTDTGGDEDEDAFTREAKLLHFPQV
jgi:hypothetical protein